MVKDPTLEPSPMEETSHRNADSVVHSPAVEEEQEELADVEASEANVAENVAANTVDIVDAAQDATAKFQKATTLLENLKANADHATEIVRSDHHVAADSDEEAVASEAVTEAAVAVHVVQAHLAVVIMRTLNPKPLTRTHKFHLISHKKKFFYIA